MERLLKLLLSQTEFDYKKHGTCNLALRIAVEEGNAAIVLVLLDKTPTDVDTDREYIGCVLNRALMDGKLAVVKIPLDHGADFDATRGLYDNVMKIAAHPPLGE